MSQFDESKIRRDGSGKFAEKPPAPEANGVELSAPDPAAGKHRASAETYRALADDLRAQIDTATIEMSKHQLAQYAAENPEVVSVELGTGSGDSGGRVQWAERAYTASGEKLRTDLPTFECPETDPDGKPALGEFTADGDERTIDMGKVREWSQGKSEVTPSTVALGMAMDASKKSEYQDMKKMSSTVRERFPEARYVNFGEADSFGAMSYESITDADGNVLHADDGGDEVVSRMQAANPDYDYDDLPEDYDEFTNRMGEIALDMDDRGDHWTDAAADDPDDPLNGAVWRDKHTGTVRKAKLDLDKIDGWND